MHSFAAFIRRNANRAFLELSRFVYPVLSSKRKLWLFEKSVDVKKFDTDVKVIKKDSDTVWIEKADAAKPFRVLTTTDIHLGDDPSLRHKAMQMLATHIYNEKPDLVIFTGDIVLSRFQQLDAVQFARFMEQTGVYWSITFGNHEAREEKGFFKWLMIDSYRHYPHCIVLHGDDNLYGYANSCINIMKSDGSMLQSLYLLDSGRDIRDEYRNIYNVPEEMKGYDFLKKEQIEWYKNKVCTARKKYGDVKSMMYFHIPIPEFKEVMRHDENGNYIPTDEANILYGGMYESVGCSEFNSGMFDAILSEGSTQAIFCGHDHVNDFCAIYKGVYFVYSQCDGYETYTMADKLSWTEEKWMQGVTVTDIMPDGTLDISPRYNRSYLKK